MASPIGLSFLDSFAAPHDPRQSWKVIYPLLEVLLTVLAGTIAGAEDFVEVRRWAKLHMDFLHRFLPFTSGIPSHDTLNDIMNAIDGELFATCFTQWVSSLGGIAANPETGPEVVAVDGKTSRRTHDRAQDRNPLHLVSAWASGQCLVLGQQACEAKSNEITAIPLLLDRLAICGALVTIDAMGCQTKIVQKILDRQADYPLAVKDDWPNLHAEIARAFDDPKTTGLLVHDTTDGDHGRIEHRHHAVSHDVAFLQTDRRFPGEPRFPGLKAIAMVETEVERNGKISRERRFYLSSLPLGAELFARAVREHWHIENRLHWVLDVVFHEDLSRLRSGYGPQHMATVRHIALNLLRGASDQHSLKVRRKSAAWDEAYLEAVIRHAARNRSSDSPAGRHRTRPISTGCRRSRRPEPGRDPLNEAPDAVQTNRATSMPERYEVIAGRHRGARQQQEHFCQGMHDRQGSRSSSSWENSLSNAATRAGANPSSYPRFIIASQRESKPQGITFHDPRPVNRETALTRLHRRGLVIAFACYGAAI